MKVQSRKSNGTRIFSISRNGKTLVNGLFRKRKGLKLHRIKTDKQSYKVLFGFSSGATFKQVHFICFTIGIEKRIPKENRELYNWEAIPTNIS